MARPPEARLELNPFWGRLPADTVFVDHPRDFHRTLPGYSPTPLVVAQSLATEIGLGALYIKDEAHRFGLNSFKGLGPIYALQRMLERLPAPPVTVAAASEGNHGRALAWAAAQVGCHAVIYMGTHVEEWRRQAIRDLGASVKVVDGAYDDAVLQAAMDCARHDWLLVSDTAIGGAEGAAVPIVRGYTTLFDEVRQQLSETGENDPHFVFLQAGVGGLAAAGVQSFASIGRGPAIVTVEPLGADCLLSSIRTSQGEVASVGTRHLATTMSCLNCARPSETAWPWIRGGVNAFIAIDDEWAHRAVNSMERAGIASQPSGAAGLGGVLALAGHHHFAEARELLDFGEDSRVLVINSEGGVLRPSLPIREQNLEVV